MTDRVGGARRKARYKLKKEYKNRGKLSIRKFMSEFKPGDKVILSPDSYVQKGCFHLRFCGKSGKVVKKAGSCYEVEIRDGDKLKTLTIHPVHLKRC